jgi:hypothetical protein
MKSYCPSGDDRITGWWAEDSSVTENCRVIGTIHDPKEQSNKPSKKSDYDPHDIKWQGSEN